MSAKPAAPPPPAPSRGGVGQAPAITIPQRVDFKISEGVEAGPERDVIYGSQGIGKSTLASWLPNPLFIDVDRGTRKLDVRRIGGITTFTELRGVLATLYATPPKDVRTIVLDTITVAEDLAKQHVLATVPNEKGAMVKSIEGYGWNKGWQYVADEFDLLIGDLDRLADDRGFNICLIAHDTSSVVPNPNGEDFLRWEPDLYPGDKKGKGSNRNRIKRWADNILFVAYAMHVKDGRARGDGTRMIYTYEMPTHIAKNRSVAIDIEYRADDLSRIWRELGTLPRGQAAG